MKNQTTQFSREAYAQMHARQAIEYITKWVEDRYPVLSKLSKSRLITQCLIEIREERKNLSMLN